MDSVVGTDFRRESKKVVRLNTPHAHAHAHVEMMCTCVHAGLPPPPEKDDYLASRCERFFAEMRDYRPGLTRADVEDPGHRCVDTPPHSSPCTCMSVTSQVCPWCVQTKHR